MRLQWQRRGARVRSRRAGSGQRGDVPVALTISTGSVSKRPPEGRRVVSETVDESSALTSLGQRRNSISSRGGRACRKYSCTTELVGESGEAGRVDGSSELPTANIVTASMTETSVRRLNKRGNGSHWFGASPPDATAMRTRPGAMIVRRSRRGANAPRSTMSTGRLLRSASAHSAHVLACASSATRSRAPSRSAPTRYADWRNSQPRIRSLIRPREAQVP